MCIQDIMTNLGLPLMTPYSHPLAFSYPSPVFTLAIASNQTVRCQMTIVLTADDFLVCFQYTCTCKVNMVLDKQDVRLDFPKCPHNKLFSPSTHSGPCLWSPNSATQRNNRFFVRRASFFHGLLSEWGSRVTRFPQPYLIQMLILFVSSRQIQQQNLKS